MTTNLSFDIKNKNFPSLYSEEKEKENVKLILNNHHRNCLD